jgi:hypothetical protein
MFAIENSELNKEFYYEAHKREYWKTLEQLENMGCSFYVGWIGAVDVWTCWVRRYSRQNSRDCIYSGRVTGCLVRP